MNQNYIERFRVSSTFGDYMVDEFNKIDDLLASLTEKPDPYFLIDDFVHKQFGLGGLIPKDRTLLLNSSEKTKNLSTVAEVSAWLASNHADKTSTLIAIGGGVIQDIATFTSAIYFRGMNWVFVPTTLLAMADSCIGAKCALNIPNHKNQVGLLHAPSQVVLFRGFLDGLTEDLILSGLGEILKLSLTGPNQFFDIFVKNAGDRSEVFDLALRSLKAKLAIIEEDELEESYRRILNYGHSFGHAIEAISDGKISHGEAVVFGIDIINFLGEHWGITSKQLRDEVSRVVEAVFPKIKWPVDDNLPSLLLDQLKHDKKVKGEVLVFAVLSSIGVLELVPKPLDDELLGLVKRYFEFETTRFSN